MRAREARAHAIILALIGWSFAVASGVVGPGNRSVFGQVKWSDFAHFYTLGDIARSRDTSALYIDQEGFERQAQLVAGSETERYFPVYGPQVAMLFAPLSRLPYGLAGLVWMAISSAVYLWCVRMAWKPARNVLEDERFVVVAALAFPPAWQLAAYGQTTAIPLIAFTVGWLALEKERRFAAGLALGLLALKPQLGLVLAPVAIITGEWRVVAGILTSVLAQAALALAWFGAPVLVDYWYALGRIPKITALLEPDAYKMHSIATLTDLLPGSMGMSIWAIASIFVITAVILVWRSVTDWRVRCGVLVIASVLVSPHVAIYDLAVLVLPALWLGGWMLQAGLGSDWFWQRLYWLAAATLVPTAALVKVQASVVILIELFVWLVVESTRYARTARTATTSGTSRAIGRRRPASL